MSFLAICLSPTLLLVVNVAVKSCLAVIQLMSCLQTVQMKMFHNSILILHILSVGLLFTYRFSLQKFVDASQNRCICFVLFGNCTHLRSYAQKAKHSVKVFILEMKHIMVPLVHLVTVNKFYSWKNRFLSSFYTYFFSCFFFFLSFSMWCAATFPEWIF